MIEPYNDIKEIEKAITSPDFSHTRCRQWCGVWLTYIYHRAGGPTGVSLAIGDHEEIVTPLLKKHGRTSPLSPTERR